MLAQSELLPVAHWPAAGLPASPPARWRWADLEASPASSPTWSGIWGAENNTTEPRLMIWTFSTQEGHCCDLNYQWLPIVEHLNMQSSVVAWVRLACLSHHLRCFVLFGILSVLIVSLCSSWARLPESTGVFGSLTSCQHLYPFWKNRQSFHFSCLSPFAKEFSKKSSGYSYAVMYDSVSLIGIGQWWIRILLLFPQLLY